MVLNVYDLPDQEATNNRLLGVGAGFYHSGVQVGRFLSLTRACGNPEMCVCADTYCADVYTTY